MSVASAAAACTNASGGIVICDSSTSDISSTLGITWNGLNGGTAIYQPGLQGGQDPIKNLNFQFGSGNSHSGSADDYLATIQGNTITINGTGKTLQMADGSGTLSVDFQNTYQHNFVLEVDSFKGNINILEGGNFKADITNDFIGNIDVKASKQYNVQYRSSSTLNFSGDYRGDLRFGIGVNKVNFKKDGVNFVGDIVASVDYGSMGEAINTIIFEKSATVGLSSEDQIRSERGQNDITFQGENNIIKSTILTGVPQSKLVNDKAKFQNYLIFDTTSTNNQVLGQIIIENNGLNQVEFKNTTGSSTIGSEANKTSNIIESQYGTNTIIFSGGGSGSIYGNISALGSGFENAKALNKIDFSGTGEHSITGDIIATIGSNGTKGENKISFASSVSSTINGNIHAKIYSVGGGDNTVDFSGTGANTINGSVIAEYKGNNTVNFTNGDKNAIRIAEGGVVVANGGTNSISSTSGLSIKGNIIAKANFLSPYNGSINTINVSGNAASSIQGNIITENSQGTSTQQNNIKIKGNNTVDSNLIGDIINDYGKINIILDQTIWAPTNASTLTSGKIPQGVSTGNVTTRGGETTVIYRQGSTNVLGNSVGEFNINNQNGTTNIVMQTGADELHMKSNINYSAGTINLIFARENNGDSSVTGGAGGSGAQSESFDGVTNSSQNTFFGITYQDGVKLTIQDIKTDIGNRQNVSILQEYGRYALSSQYLLSVDSDRDRTNAQDSVGLSGLIIGAITQLDASTTKKTYNVNLNANSVFIGNIDLSTTVNTINLVMEDKSKMILTSDAVSIAKLTVNGTTKINKEQFVMNTLDQSENKIINLATGGASSNNVKVRPNFRALGIQTIDGSGSLVFVNYVNQNADQNTATLGGKDKQTRASNAYADRVIIENGGNASAQLTGEYYMQLAFDIGNISAIHYDETKAGAEKDSTNIAVATIAKVTNAGNGTSEAEIRAKGVIALQEANSLQGFDELATTLKAVETQQDGLINSGGSNDYITYFVDSVKTAGANIAVQESTSTIAAASLDIYMANFNSLNKRMGELRDNANSQGAWGRIFGGQQTSDFGLGSTTGYVTVQAGYDYAFGFEGANNYLGFALAYGYSSSSTNSATNTLSGANEGIEGDLKSNMVEVGIYNAYVQDEGWYNDSIFKFSYMMQDFTQSGTASGNSVSTNNFGIILSDEFGYRFKLGDAKEWYIDPQLEVAFGYVNGTEYTQISGGSTLDTKVDALMQLRARFGSSFGYDFKQFTQGKGVDAKLYVGAFYEYDYFNGGDLTLTTNLGGVNSIQSSLASDGRVVVNVGTNVTVKENTRIYFDFETSFAGKIRTDYQANVGVRYSFGENTSYIPNNPTKKEVAPLKIEESKIEGQNTQETTQVNTQETQQ